MSEPRPMIANELVDTARFRQGLPDAPYASGRGDNRSVALPATKNRPGQNDPTRRSFWLRSFFSLRAQLVFAYSILLALVALIAALLIYMQPSRYYVALVAAVVVVVGSILAYVCTTLLLRPLGRVIDASQAIALGDLEQRDRLILHQPPQDDIDRLAGSLNEMVTRLEKAEELQHVSEQSFRQFFSDASHQLRTPLTSIRGFTEILIRGAIDDMKTREHVLLRLKSESERMTLLINDLLTLARLSDGYPLKLQYADLIELATEAIEQTRRRANDERVISLEIATGERLGVQVDCARIKQVLFILLDNALKYGRQAPEGKITFSLDKQANKAVLRISDNGEGILQEDLEHIFESFYRGRQRRSPNQNSIAGTGLGLTIAHSIVQAHNGSISATSEPGKGTQFVVVLPCVE